ncbi:MAG: alkaline phosphatase D family protein [Arhodomonas sp.]|nr:alkaline phosphatase D family protein [Arhodomonas sp.]
MVRTDTTGTLSWVGDGVADDVSLDTAFNDGWGYLEITGLVAGKTHSGVASVGGASIKVSPKTMPQTGGVIGWTSCQVANVDTEQSTRRILEHGIDAFVWLGDFFYPNSNAVVFGGVDAPLIDSVAEATDSANWSLWWRHQMNNPGFKLLAHTVPVYCMFDDHEIGGGDNWDHTVDKANSGVSALGAVNQGEVNDAWAASIDAYDAIAQAQPFDGGSVKKPQAVLDGEATYPVNNDYYVGRYYAFDVGDLHVQVLDTVSHRDPLTQTDNFSKKMLANPQRDWSEADIAASPGKANVIFCTKKFWTQNGEGGDAFNLYETERSQYLDAIGATGKTVMYGVGDRHEISAAYDNANKALHLNPCPLRQKWVPSLDAGYQIFSSGSDDAEIIYRYYGDKALAHASGGEFDQDRAPGAFGIYRRGETYTEGCMLHYLTGRRYLPWQRIADADAARTIARPRIAG